MRVEQRARRFNWKLWALDACFGVLFCALCIGFVGSGFVWNWKAFGSWLVIGSVLVVLWLPFQYVAAKYLFRRS